MLREYNSVIHTRSYPIGTTGIAEGVRIPISVWRQIKKVETKFCFWPCVNKIPGIMTIHVVLAFGSIKDLKMKFTKKTITKLEFMFFFVLL